MMKNFKAMKASLIMGILLTSMFVAIAFVPRSSAKLINYGVDLEFNYDLSGIGEVIPLDKAIRIPMTVKYKISGLIGADSVANLLQKSGISAQVEIIVGETPSWVSAVVTPNNNVLIEKISTSFEAGEIRYLEVRFTKDAPAKIQVAIPITLSAQKIDQPFFTISDKTLTGNNIAINTAFLPVVDVQPKRRLVETGPGNIASFEVDLINEGNAETYFIFNSINVTDGWIVAYPEKVLVNPRETKTITIDITPPYGFGWHDELETIKISYYGRYFASTPGETMESDVDEVNLNVRSRGFSITSFEIVIIIILIAIIILIFYLFKKLALKKK